MVRRIRVAVLKLLTCMVGGVIVGLCICRFYTYASVEMYFGWSLAGTAFGLFVGTSWVIKRKAVRTAFVFPPSLGLLIYLIGWLITRSIPVMASPKGLFIGTVWALSNPGAFSTKQIQESTLSNSGVDVTEEIRKLAELNSEGILTDGEFESKKQELLAKL